MVDMEKLGLEARAKITWGDPPDEVLAWLIEKGMPQPRATEVVEQLSQLRDQSMRARGRRDLMLGIGSVVGTIVIGLLLVFGAGDSGTVKGRGLGIALALCLLGFLWGSNRVARGIECVIKGGKTVGSDTSVESDNPWGL